MLEIKPEIKDRVISHEKSVVCVKYNRISNLVKSFILFLLLLFIKVLCNVLK